MYFLRAELSIHNIICNWNVVKLAIVAIGFQKTTKLFISAINWDSGLILEGLFVFPHIATQFSIDFALAIGLGVYNANLNKHKHTYEINLKQIRHTIYK